MQIKPAIIANPGKAAAGHAVNGARGDHGSGGTGGIGGIRAGSNPHSEGNDKLHAFGSALDNALQGRDTSRQAFADARLQAQRNENAATPAKPATASAPATPAVPAHVAAPTDDEEKAKDDDAPPADDAEAAFAHFRHKKAFAHWDEQVLRDYITYGTHDEDGERVLSFDRDVETAIYNTLPDNLERLLKRHPLKCPAAFIGGLQSEELKQVGTALTARVTQGRMAMLDGSHLFPMEKPLATAAAVEAALRAM